MSKDSTLSDVLDALQSATGYVPSRSGDGYKARCPAHDDHDPSLSVSEGSDGRVLLNCHAACEVQRICTAIGWSVSQLFPAGGFDSEEPSAVYSFRDETGSVLYQEVRFPGKQFRMRRPAGDGSWIWSLDDVERVPYRLGELCNARMVGGDVIFVEGPKDADCLAAKGFNSTTVIGGAKGWTHEYAAHFHGLDLVICGDHDKPGQALVDTVCRSIAETAASVKVVDLFPDTPLSNGHGEDVSDWFDRGGTAERLRTE